MRYFIHIGYHGACYSGWQRHPGVLSIQQVIEAALSQIFKAPIGIIGCGRTDAQVHASQFFFHVDIEGTWEFDLIFRLNKLLPNDIAIFDIIPMEGLPHARFDAVYRSYDYFIHTHKDPFLNSFSSYYPINNFRIDEMKRAVALLPLYNDYHAFCKSPDRNEHTICNISSARIYASPGGNKLRFHVTANRFLSKMVRAIVGKLLHIGTNKLSVDEFESYLITKQTPDVITPAHPQGLYLTKVTYPYLDIAERSTFTTMLQKDVDGQ